MALAQLFLSLMMMGSTVAYAEEAEPYVPMDCKNPVVAAQKMTFKVTTTITLKFQEATDEAPAGYYSNPEPKSAACDGSDCTAAYVCVLKYIPRVSRSGPRVTFQAENPRTWTLINDGKTADDEKTACHEETRTVTQNGKRVQLKIVRFRFHDSDRNESQLTCAIQVKVGVKSYDLPDLKDTFEGENLALEFPPIEKEPPRPATPPTQRK